MTIDLTDPANVTPESVAALIASVDDSIDRQLRVTKDGKAFLSDTVGNVDIDGLAFRFETWLRGNDYVGKRASDDNEWVQRIYEALRDNWPNPTSTFLDSY